MKLNLNPFNLRFFQTILFLLAAVPCGIPYRYQPNPVFPSELAAFIFASLLVLGAVFVPRRDEEPVVLPWASLIWFGLAGVVGLQYWFIDTPYLCERTVPMLYFGCAGLSVWALARAKAQTVAGLRQEETSPQAVAYRQFIQAIYGRHPYANEARLTPAAVEAIGREDVRAFWQQHYRPGYMSIAIVGDLTRREAAELAQQLTRGLPRTGAPLPEVPPVPQPAAQRLSQPHVASQASVALGLPLLTRDDPDYYPLVVGNYVLGGGGFDSRLMTELRSKRGLTYGASSMLAPYTAPGEFMVSVSTRKAQADEARRVARETLEKFVADGPSAPELEQAKANIIGGFPLRYDSNKKLIEYVAAIGFYNLPLTWLDDYPRAVEQVTPEAVRDAYRRRVGLDHLVEVVVGGSNEPDRSKVEREQEQQ
mgnify:CR=1 FL=1